MDYSKAYEAQFQEHVSYIETDINLFGKLQDTRHSLQESISENDQLSELINLLYSEIRVENVAVGELVDMIAKPLFKNIALPRSADGISLSEKAGYVMYYMKFLGYAARKSLEEYHVTKEHMEGLHKSISANTVEMTVKRTGKIKIPELDGEKEMKRSAKTATPLSPPITPPNHKENPNKNKGSK